MNCYTGVAPSKLNNFSYLVLNDGTLTGIGSNSDGQLNITSKIATGVSTNLLPGSIGVGYNHALFVLKDGTVTGLGSNTLNQLNIPTAIQNNTRAVAGGFLFSIALLNDGRVTGWGYNSVGETVIPAGIGTNATGISVGNNFVLALLKDGRVTGWGSSTYTNIPSGIGNNASAISAGPNHSVALLKDGRVTGWGTNNYGELNIPTGIGNNATGISVGGLIGGHTLVLLKNGRVTGWGDNLNNQLNLPVSIGNNANQVYAGYGSSFALLNNGRVTGWGYNSSGQATVPICQLNQNITFNTLPTKIINDPLFYLTGYSDSNLPLTYSSSNTGVAVITNISGVLITGVGSSVISGTQTGNFEYNAATPVARTLTVNKIDQTITLPTIPNKNSGDAPFFLSGTTTSNLPITYSSSNTGVLNISGGSGVLILTTGSSIISGTQTGNQFYNAATPVSQSVTVGILKANQTITLPTIPSKTYGDPLFYLSGTTTSNLPITYSSSDTGILSISGSSGVLVIAPGSSVISGVQTGNLFFNAATPVSQIVNVSKANQTITLPTISNKSYGDSLFYLSGSTTSNLPITYSSSDTGVLNISGSSGVLVIGVGSSIISGVQTGNEFYNAATPVSQNINVLKINQSIGLPASILKTYEEGSFYLNLNTDLGLPITYTGNNSIVATINGNLVTILNTGSMIISGVQTGNQFYNAATGSGILSVSKGNQTITFEAILDKVLNAGSFILDATSSSSLPITYSSSNTGVISLSGNLVIPKSIGTVTITANQTGNELYNAAISVSNTFEIIELPFISQSDLKLNIKTNNIINNLNYNIKISGSPSIIKSFDLNDSEPFYLGLEKDHVYSIDAKTNEEFFEFENINQTQVLSSNTYTDISNLNIDFSQNEPELDIYTQINNSLTLTYKLDDITTPSGIESTNKNQLKAFTIDYKTFDTGEVLNADEIPSLTYSKYVSTTYCVPKQVIIQPGTTPQEDPCTADFSCAICSEALKIRSNNPSQTFIDVPQDKMLYRIYGNLVDYIFTDAHPGFYRIALNDKLFSLCCQCQEQVDCKKELGVGGAGGGGNAFITCKQDNLFNRPKNVNENTINQEYGLYFLDAITLRSIKDNYGPSSYYSGVIKNVNNFIDGDKIIFNQYAYPFENVYKSIYGFDPTHSPVNAEFIYSTNNVGDEYFFTASELVDKINLKFNSSGIYTWIPMLYAKYPAYSYGPLLHAELKDDSTISLASLQSGRLGENQISLTFGPRSVITSYLVPQTIELQGSNDGINWYKIVSSEDVQPVNLLKTSYNTGGGAINYQAIDNTKIIREITVPTSSTVGNRIVPSGTTATSGDLSNLIEQIESGNKQFETGNGATIVCVPTAGKFSKICGSGYIELWIPSGCPVPELPDPSPKESGVKEDDNGDKTEEKTEEKTMIVEENTFRVGFADYR